MSSGIPTELVQADMKNNTSASMHDMHDPIHGLDSNLLKVAVGLSALVFIIMLQAHHNHDPDSPHSGYITGVCHNIAVEVFDSVSTGYFLSDQHILSPINPKYDDWFCQIYTNCSVIQNCMSVYFNEFVANALRNNIVIVNFDLPGYGGC